MRRIPVVLVAVLAGCGGGEADGPPAAEAARDVAKRYLDAVAAKDWEAACETRVRAEREPVGATCPATLMSLLGAADTAAYARAEIGAARVVGERADIDFRVPGQDSTQRLAAVVEDGEWRLQDSGY